jgi:hypothetical protein
MKEMGTLHWSKQIANKVGAAKRDALRGLVRSESRRLWVPFFGNGADAALYELWATPEREVRYADLRAPSDVALPLAQRDWYRRAEVCEVFAEPLDGCDIAAFFPDLAAFNAALPVLHANPARSWRLGLLCWAESPRSTWLERHRCEAAVGNEIRWLTDRVLASWRVAEPIVSQFMVEVGAADVRPLLAASGIPATDDDKAVRIAIDVLGWQSLDHGRFGAPFAVAAVTLDGSCARRPQEATWI